MLTKDDLRVFRKLVREEVEAEGKNIKDDLGYDISSLKIRVSAELGEVKDRLKNLEIRVLSVEKIVKKTNRIRGKLLRPRLNRQIKRGQGFITAGFAQQAD